MLEIVECDGSVLVAPRGDATSPFGRDAEPCKERNNSIIATPTVLEQS